MSRQQIFAQKEYSLSTEVINFYSTDMGSFTLNSKRLLSEIDCSEFTMFSSSALTNIPNGVSSTLTFSTVVNPSKYSGVTIKDPTHISLTIPGTYLIQATCGFNQASVPGISAPFQGGSIQWTRGTDTGTSNIAITGSATTADCFFMFKKVTTLETLLSLVLNGISTANNTSYQLINNNIKITFLPASQLI